MVNILVTGATGKTGGLVLKLLLEKGHHIRALAHSRDERTEKLEKQGVEIAVGDLLDLNSVSNAAKGINRAYFVYPIRPGIIQATGYFAQVAKENNFDFIVNMSQISSRREAVSHAAQDHWIAEQVFNWSGVPTAHVRPTFFAEWLLYQAENVKYNDRLTLPYDGKHAPIAALDQAHVIANILDAPNGHAGKAYPLFGPEELTQSEIAGEVSEALGRKIQFDHVSFDDFFKAIMSRPNDSGKATAENMYGSREETDEGRKAREFLYNHLKNVSEDHDNGIFWWHE
jgi:uncharacterized protein YbjT (DUF2867 family)